MIKFALKCPEGHRFDSWFQSAEAFDKLARTGHVTCADCGSTDVTKSVMAPSVQSAPAAAPEKGALPAAPAERAIARLRRRIEATSEYVGSNFAREARDMHDGRTPERPIYGEARADDARKLVEDGVPVLPLPFRPTRKVN
jgi:hypothetical protein